MYASSEFNCIAPLVFEIVNQGPYKNIDNRFQNVY